MDTQSQLALTLVWMRQYCIEAMLGWIFGVSESTVYKYNRVTLSILFSRLKPTVSLLSSEERLKNGVSLRGAQITVIGDGSEQQIITFTQKQLEQVTYSAKKGRHTFTKLLYCSPTGIPYFISHSYPGSMNDLNLCHLPENEIFSKLESWEYVGFDGGFKGTDKLHKVVLPIEENGKGPLDSNETKFNNEFCAIRTVVENVFAHIKQWSICRYPFRANKGMDKMREEHNMVWTVCTAMVKRFIGPFRSYPIPGGETTMVGGTATVEPMTPTTSVMVTLNDTAMTNSVNCNRMSTEDNNNNMSNSNTRWEHTSCVNSNSEQHCEMNEQQLHEL